MKVSAPLVKLAALPSLLATVSAVGFHRMGMEPGPVDDDTELLGTNGTNGWGTFDQLIDHSNPSLGTFEQRFWYGTEYWKGSGSPIIITNPGEQSATGFKYVARLPPPVFLCWFCCAGL